VSLFLERRRHAKEQVQRRANHRHAARGRATTTSVTCRKHGISEQTLYRWKAKYGGMEASDAKRLRALEDENRRLKTLVADLTLDKRMLEAVVQKKF
jgi:putative transposase